MLQRIEEFDKKEQEFEREKAQINKFNKMHLTVNELIIEKLYSEMSK